MVLELDMQDGETLIEIGAGLGALTLEIVNHFGSTDIAVKALEIDLRFVDKLNNMFEKVKNIEIIETNALTWLPTFNPQKKPFKIIGSLPYYITSPLIHRLVKMPWQPEMCVLLIQKEVAQKISAKAPDSSYFSTFVQTFYEVEYMETVNKKDFSPVPKVDGGVIKLTRRKDSKVKDIDKYEGFLHLAYSNPRKMLNKMFKEDELNRGDLDGKLRAQNYDWEKWVETFTILR
jgi:16S rRNA (adenine1518-N6/adenine1519-N6)-dimethyltransferase